MRDSFKKTLTAAIFAMFVALPLGALAAEQPGVAPAHMPASVQESLSSIVSTPLTSDGGLIVDRINQTPFTTHETTSASCVVLCFAGECTYFCW